MQAEEQAAGLWGRFWVAVQEQVSEVGKGLGGVGRMRMPQAHWLVGAFVIRMWGEDSLAPDLCVSVEGVPWDFLAREGISLLAWQGEMWIPCLHHGRLEEAWRLAQEGVCQEA